MKKEVEPVYSSEFGNELNRVQLAVLKKFNKQVNSKKQINERNKIPGKNSL